MHHVPPRNKQGKRWGFTTGACATAAATAAAQALITGRPVSAVCVRLPIGFEAFFQPIAWRVSAEEAACCIIKDGGDDPDITHGTRICARVRWDTTRAAGLTIEGGVGVGRVTRPGLGLPVGGPAINPVPRRMIDDHVRAVLGDLLDRRAVEVIIEVPEGERLAQQTLNPRLGIVGGISILGTTGVVFPYSTAAWRASVVQAAEMAALSGAQHLVLATGGRSEAYARTFYPDLPENVFVEMSVFTGAALKTCAAYGVPRVSLVGMIGKLVKTAQGHMTTHVAGNQVDFAFLADICRDVGSAPALVDAVRHANTARHFLELCRAADDWRPVRRVVEEAARQCAAFVADMGARMEIEVVLVDFDGTALARARAVAEPAGEASPPPRPSRLFVERAAEGEEGCQ
ncbi:cobalt-precorrin-5B (C(1))-methyltransferase [Ardenticatena maritima]|uniref:Cobalt-precorrin-5B C(1)-methyltransferase n=2 Tax=Ardenticatena maritima TaxID=872965 RepID=A0A0P6Y4H9_9CHLR|nr:cobalt-precorrin-5B (C(1))-methyltransferase [Ardenticatena maritima]KPL87583.1 cobalt-precorrin-6A synthase [Ardenticatena maritima]